MSKFREPLQRFGQKGQRQQPSRSLGDTQDTRSNAPPKSDSLAGPSDKTSEGPPLQKVEITVDMEDFGRDDRSVVSFRPLSVDGKSSKYTELSLGTPPASN
ncbi:hypothetical protein QFC24_006166 [Naganishia onofrii]|uniref:Uncharacterized protein n=1 Tax=Naganishia onofrii TaxID=1851511 RepID=A0ACC2X416_9TREE|nr:hypothetical protein QFC24_006166 [Naganishia onofrii]